MYYNAIAEHRNTIGLYINHTVDMINNNGGLIEKTIILVSFKPKDSCEEAIFWLDKMTECGFTKDELKYEYNLEFCLYLIYSKPSH